MRTYERSPNATSIRVPAAGRLQRLFAKQRSRRIEQLWDIEDFWSHREELPIGKRYMPHRFVGCLGDPGGEREWNRPRRVAPFNLGSS